MYITKILESDSKELLEEEMQQYLSGKSINSLTISHSTCAINRKIRYSVIIAFNDTNDEELLRVKQEQEELRKLFFDEETTALRRTRSVISSCRLYVYKKPYTKLENLILGCDEITSKGLAKLSEIKCEDLEYFSAESYDCKVSTNAFVLKDISTLENLVKFFQNIYNNVSHPAREITLYAVDIKTGKEYKWANEYLIEYDADKDNFRKCHGSRLDSLLRSSEETSELSKDLLEDEIRKLSQEVVEESEMYTEVERIISYIPEAYGSKKFLKVLAFVHDDIADPCDFEKEINVPVSDSLYNEVIAMQKKDNINGKADADATKKTEGKSMSFFK